MKCMPSYSTGCKIQSHVNEELSKDQVNNFLFQRSGSTGTFPPPSTVTPTPEPPSPSKQPTNPTLSPFPPLSYLARLPRPRLGPVPYGQVITSCNAPGQVALSFDDGPWKYTSDLLDLLEHEGVRATFFVCGGNMEDDQLTGYGHPRLLRRMLAAGHQIGSHTWEHLDLASLPRDQVRRQMLLNEQALAGTIGRLPTYFRPPYLSWEGHTLDVAAELGYHVASLDLDTRD